MLKKEINILIILFLISLIPIFPIIITLINPKFSYGSSKIGFKHQKINETIINIDNIGWISYAFLFIYIIYLCEKYIKGPEKRFYQILCLYILYISSIWPFLIIVNSILNLYFNNKPFISNHYFYFPKSKEIEDNYSTIKQEYKNFEDLYEPSCLHNTNPGFKIEKSHEEKNCWRTINLKYRGKMIQDMIPHFPITTKLLEDEQIHNAFFSILDPNVEITPHVGYYKGYLRYHIGVEIPNINEKKAFIECGGIKYEWNEGEGVLFDDMFMHYVKNPTNMKRTVLYLDIKRKNASPFIKELMKITEHYIENNFILNKFIKNQHTQKKI